MRKLSLMLRRYEQIVRLLFVLIINYSIAVCRFRSSLSLSAISLSLEES